MTAQATEPDRRQWEGKDPTRVVVRFEYDDAPNLEHVYPGADHRTITWTQDTRAEPVGGGRAVLVHRMTFSWEFRDTDPLRIARALGLLSERDLDAARHAQLMAEVHALAGCVPKVAERPEPRGVTDALYWRDDNGAYWVDGDAVDPPNGVADAQPRGTVQLWPGEPVWR
jgi:hypothetical protein